MNDAWAIAHNNFDTDDGSLPGIDFANLQPQMVLSIYRYFQTNGTIETKNATIYSESRKADLPLEEIENGAQLVIDGDSHSFHCCYSGIVFASQELPTLGLFVFADSIEIDYQMGPHWNRDNVNAMFSFLAYLKSLCPGCTVESATTEGLPYPKTFREALDAVRGWQRSNEREAP